MDIQTFTSVDETKAAAHKKLEEVLQQSKETDILFLTSGGSALGLLTSMTIPGMSRVSVGVLDERLSTHVTINNLLLLKNTPWFAENVASIPLVMNSLPEESDTVDTLAMRMDDQLRRWKNGHPEGRIVVTQGIGADGHTAGILPFPEDPGLFTSTFVTTQSWVVGYTAIQAKSEHRERVTVTMPFLQTQVDTAIFYIVGAEKKPMLERLVVPSDDLATLPGRIVHHMKDVHIFTDQQISPST